MRPHRLTLVVVLGASSLGVATAGAGRETTPSPQAPGPQPEAKAPQAAPKEKTAGEAFKNVQVLKDISESEFMSTMFLFRASLGVGCDHCHVTSDRGAWPLEKDDKPDKLVAREMIKMTRTANDQTFGGRQEVGCATCHQGSLKPASLPPVPPLGARPDEEGAEGAKDLPAADSVLERYWAALGGSTALEKIKTRESSGTLLGESGKTYAVHQVQKAPDLFVTTVSGPNFAEVLGFDGKSAWQKWGDQTFVQQDLEGDRIARSGEFWVDMQVKKIYPRRVVDRVAKIGDEDAYVVRAGGPGAVSEMLYFSRATGLLLRRVVLTKTPMGRLPQETDFGDYRDVDGIKEPFTIQRREINARFTVKLTEIKHNVPVEDSVFRIPPGAK